jgi:hypothetical protein
MVEVIDMAGVMIGIDPHKGSHTACALDEREQQAGQVRVRASATQVQVLLSWARGLAAAHLGGRGLEQSSRLRDDQACWAGRARA